MAADAVVSLSKQALNDEIVASELLRIRALIGLLAVTTMLQTLVLSLWGDQIAALALHPVPWWIPLAVVGPFITYDSVVLFVLSRFVRSKRDIPTIGRFANAVVETSLPTVAIFVVHHFSGLSPAFGSWPPLLYFIFIVASTLRLNFALPFFTGLVAASEFLGAAVHLAPLTLNTSDPFASPIYYASKAVLMVAAGSIAGLVALRLRAKFLRVMEEATARERVTSLFGQHVSPAVVDRLLDQPAEASGETREAAVMFLDIRNFTAAARTRRPSEVVDFLNRHFAFMIDAVDRNHGIVNKFLGDGFMAVFGAPLADKEAARHAVQCARDILAEIDRRGLAEGPWPLRIGIGLDIGVVMTGNVGSPRRKEYTVIGDAVNLASRLEQLNKEYGTRLLVSDAVMRAAGLALGPADALGEVMVKGYVEPVRVWRLDPYAAK